MTHPQAADHDEFITIIGTSMDDIAAEFRAQGLSEKRYSVVHRTGRHRFTHVGGDGAQALFGDQQVIAATYRLHGGA